MAAGSDNGAFSASLFVGAMTGFEAARAFHCAERPVGNGLPIADVSPDPTSRRQGFPTQSVGALPPDLARDARQSRAGPRTEDQDLFRWPAEPLFNWRLAAPVIF